MAFSMRYNVSTKVFRESEKTAVLYEKQIILIVNYITRIELAIGQTSQNINTYNTTRRMLYREYI